MSNPGGALDILELPQRGSSASWPANGETHRRHLGIAHEDVHETGTQEVSAGNQDRTTSGDSPSVLILGCRGMLGSACLRVFGVEAVGCDYAEFDIADREQVLAEVTRLHPDLIVNCAAATDVDRCEHNHDYADAANAVGPGFVAEAAATVGARLVHISTDFVFDGLKGGPYQETDTPDPLNHYGSSKLEGERAVLAALPNALIVRTSWLYGHGGAHFPAKVLAWAAGREEIRVADDQFGSPTHAADFAHGIQPRVLPLGRSVRRSGAHRGPS